MQALTALLCVTVAWGAICFNPTMARLAAQENVAKDDAAKDDAAGAEEQPQQQTALGWLVRTSGWIGAVLLVLSIYFVAKVVSLFIELRHEVATPPEIVEQCDNLLKAKDLMGVYKLVREDDSFFSNVVATGLTELPHGLASARDGMERTGDVLTVEMEKNISMLAVLGSLGPMIGLLGTLKGMITSFSAIAMSGAQLNTTRVAAGISEALVLTLEGVGLSVPAIYFFALFRNRVSTISAATMLAADEFIRRANVVSKTKPAGKASTASGE
jgi:biopolymer transport protein ExbB